MAPITIRHGHVIIHLNDASHLTSVLAAVRADELTPPISDSLDSHASLIRDTAVSIQDVISTKLNTHCSSPRDAIDTLRRNRGLSTRVFKRLTQLNAADSLLRHVSENWTKTLIHDVQKKCGNSSLDSAPSGSVTPPRKAADSMHDDVLIWKSNTLVKDGASNLNLVDPWAGKSCNDYGPSAQSTSRSDAWEQFFSDKISNSTYIHQSPARTASSDDQIRWRSSSMNSADLTQQNARDKPCEDECDVRHVGNLFQNTDNTSVHSRLMTMGNDSTFLCQAHGKIRTVDNLRLDAQRRLVCKSGRTCEHADGMVTPPHFRFDSPSPLPSPPQKYHSEHFWSLL
eukprot:gnl/MRDRNA2_/MRDRNA2_85965_c0_seq1.p1 gnl/MRDRNA2_/MRDRNA2_85965_c0~~gnl/MRDRNA2_/MRDRNA2_85965_c0_seq1.p1  ORF type:complete len:362 (-),score=29.10 gnl/MRDRNA2_/MRDRNA2_85965_c0_seq1:403-1425(-)